VYSLVRTPASAVWLVLVAATVFSWSLGTGHGFGAGSQQLAGAAILVVALVKVRFIGLYFMELRDAPFVLRGLFEAYCAVVCAAVVVLFVTGG
jgi:Prokaryotic Cytochrome C oxidase subunit IV